MVAECTQSGQEAFVVLLIMMLDYARHSIWDTCLIYDDVLYMHVLQKHCVIMSSWRRNGVLA